LAIAARTYPAHSRKKSIVFSLFALAAPLGCSTVGAIGSAFAQYLWWPGVMWLYAIGCFIIAATGLWVIPKEDYLTTRQTTTRLEFDWLGSVLGVVGLLLLNISWNQAPIDGWSTPYVYILLILGFVFMGIFVFQEKRVKQPLLETSILKDRHVVAVLVTTGLGWSSFGVWFYYLFRFIQRFRHVSPLDSAAQFASGAISGIIAAVATPYLMHRVPTGWLMAIACFAFLAGCILQATAPIHQSYWSNTFWSFVIMAWG
jgi:MFS family permease